MESQRFKTILFFFKVDLPLLIQSPGSVLLSLQCRHSLILGVALVPPAGTKMIVFPCVCSNEGWTALKQFYLLWWWWVALSHRNGVNWGKIYTKVAIEDAETPANAGTPSWGLLKRDTHGDAHLGLLQLCSVMCQSPVGSLLALYTHLWIFWCCPCSGNSPGFGLLLTILKWGLLTNPF